MLTKKNNVSFLWKPNTVIRWDHDRGMSIYYVILSVVPIQPFPDGYFQFTDYRDNWRKMELE